MFGKYEDAVDRESAFEILRARGGDLLGAPQTAAVPPPIPGAPSTPNAPEAPAAPAGPGMMDRIGGVLTGIFGGGGGRRQSVGEVMVKSVTRSIGSRMGTEIARGVLGSIFGGGRR